jgi:triacylglycerol lipase
MAENFHRIDALMQPPVRRAAYSDRTAWLMAVMSLLAYVRFEDPKPLKALAEELSGMTEAAGIVDKLMDLLNTRDHGVQRAQLEADLKDLGFTLEETYNVSVPLVVDTQAILARLDLPNRDPMLVLAFRGTEVNKVADIRSDLNANPTQVGPKEENRLVHTGFYDGFRAVEKKIREDLDKAKRADLPLYITGHSLGGALAVVATYCLASDRVAA